MMGWRVSGCGLFRQVVREALRRVTFQLSPNRCSKICQERVLGEMEVQRLCGRQCV